MALFVSWNIKGLGSPVKRSRVFAHLKRLKSDLVFLQETHIRNKDQVRLKCPWVAEVFHSNFNSKARGVDILVCKSVQYLIVAGSLCRVPVLLVNINANKSFERLPSLSNIFLIFGGDTNLAVSPYLDHSNPRSLTPTLMDKALSDCMIDYVFIDSKLISKVSSVKYHPIFTSDQAPLTLDTQISPQPRYTSLWRLNSLLLSDDKFNVFISYLSRYILSAQ
uniref:Endonuclease/exonuclease/phosphatase domain-containing protein n=1 Tax=Mola mola TaxID=94237 RepID=A0A3Q3W9E8_MOLML